MQLPKHRSSDYWQAIKQAAEEDGFLGVVRLIAAVRTEQREEIEREEKAETSIVLPRSRPPA